MTLTLSWKQIGLFAGLVVVGFLAGLGAGAALAGGSLPGEIVGPLIGLVALVIGGAYTVGRVVIERIVAELQPALTHNTNLTAQTLGVAQDAANHASERAELVQQVSATLLRAERAERIVHIIAATPDCAACRSRIAGLMDEWRTTYAGRLESRP